MQSPDPHLHPMVGNQLSFHTCAHCVDFGLLPTPSPEMHPLSIHHPHHTGHDGYIDSLPTWEVLRDEPATAGMKRSSEYNIDVDNFFMDVKKRRINPAYDHRE